MQSWNQNDGIFQTKSQSSSSSSVNTEEAFAEMLGLDGSSEMIKEIISTAASVIEEKEEKKKEKKKKRLTTTRRISLPKGCAKDHDTPELAYFISNVFSEEECQVILKKAYNTETGFYYVSSARHVADDGTSYEVTLMRPNAHKLSLLLNEDSLVRMISDRILDVIDKDQLLDEAFLTKYGQPLGINPRLRVLKYDSIDNDVFDPHFDVTTFDESKRRCSVLTVLLYLNEDFIGGETKYLDNQSNKCSEFVEKNVSEATVIEPRTGSVSLFHHDLYHCGAPLEQGTKFILRTDVLFETQKLSEATEQREGDGSLMKDWNHPSESTLKTMSELCSHLEFHGNIHAKEACMGALMQLGILHNTIESFCAIGSVMAKQLLFDVLLSQIEDSASWIDYLVSEAFAHKK